MFQVEDDTSDVEVKCWEPSKRFGLVKSCENIIVLFSTVQRIARLCPELVTLKVLMDDLNFRELEGLDMVEEVKLCVVGNLSYSYVLF